MMADKQPRPDYAVLIAVACLVMAHKFPVDLSITYLPAIFRQNGLDLEDLWILSLPLLPYWFRWIWAPLVDHNGSSRWGHRKSWILPCSLLAVVGYLGISFIEPVPVNLGLLVAMFTLTAFVMATQEVAADGYTVENIRPQDRSLGSAYIEFGRSVAAIAIAIGLMSLYDAKGWNYTMPTAAVLFLVLTLPMLLRQEPEKPKELQARFDAGMTANFAQVRKDPRQFTRAFIHPFRDFMARRESPLLVFLIIFMGTNLKLMQASMPVFLVDLGKSLTEIGVLVGLCAAGGSVLGTFLAAWLLRRYSMQTTAWICLGLLFLAFQPWLVLSFSGSANTTLVMVSLTSLGALATPTQVLVMAARFRWASRAQAGTDFTLQSSAEYVGYAVGAALAGPLAALLGWGSFYALLLLLSLSSLLIYIKAYNFIDRSLEQRDQMLAGPGAPASEESSSAIDPHKNTRGAS